MFDESFIEEWVNRVAEAVAKRIPAQRVSQRYMSFGQAGEYIGVSEESVRYYVNQNWLPVCIKGGKRWIDKEDVDRFMATNKRYVKVPARNSTKGGADRAA